MAATRRGWLRHPRTQQERRENQSKQDRLVRPSRRANRLPTNYDDIQVHTQKSWKCRRKRQWHADKTGYAWRDFRFSAGGWRYTKLRRIEYHLKRLGCYSEWIPCGVRWFGPNVT